MAPDCALPSYVPVGISVQAARVSNREVKIALNRNIGELLKILFGLSTANGCGIQIADFRPTIY
jgi:hypothetical protein